MNEMELVEEGENSQVFSPMSDSELVSACMQEVSRGIGGTVASDNDADISLPLDYYFGRLPGLSGSRAKDPNASRFVSMDVMDGVESTVAEIMPTFTTDIIAFYEPDDERDEDAARMETELVNYLFMEKYNGYTLLQVAIKDALLHRNCTVKAYWDERTHVEYERFEDIPEMALQMAMQPNQENQTVEVVEQEVSEQGNPQAIQSLSHAAMQDPEGAAQMLQQPGAEEALVQAQVEAQDKYTIMVKRMTVVGKPVIESVAPEQVIVSGNHTSPYLDDVRFVAHENLETQSSLIEQGFDPEIVNQLGDYSQNIEDLSRSREPEEYDYNSGHRSTRQIRVFECYPLIDFDGDGIAERRKVTISGNKLLDNEPWQAVPLIGGVAMVVPHKYKGISLFDRLKDVQDSKTPVIRSIVDGTQLSSNPRVGVIAGTVNIDDLLASRTGGVVRMEEGGGVVPIPNPEIPQSSYTMLQYMDMLRTERGGAAISSANQAKTVAGDTAHGIERVMSSMEMTNATIARSIGETLVRGIFIQIHNLLREHYDGEIAAKVGGSWKRSTPSEWTKRTAVSVQVGSSQAERQRQSNVLTSLVDVQRELIEKDSILTDEKKAYYAITDAARLNGIKNPERYLTDPDSPEGQDAAQERSTRMQEQEADRKQLEAQMMQAQNQIAQAELAKGQAALDSQRAKLQIETAKQQSANELATLKMQLEAYKQDSADRKAAGELAFDYEKLVMDTAVKVTEMEVNANKDLSNQVEENM